MKTGDCSECAKPWGKWKRPSEWHIWLCTKNDQSPWEWYCQTCGRFAVCDGCGDTGSLEGIGGRQVVCDRCYGEAPVYLDKVRAFYAATIDFERE
jgi:hypothetical protein